MGSRDPLPQLTMANDPLRSRPYLHIDKPPTRSAIAAAVSNPERVARWSFFPLITNIRVIRKLRRKGNSFVVKEKRRPISYASHRDAALYAYYAEKLTKLYEQRLRKLKLDHVVTAFRTGDGRCNIHFAHEAFEWIDANRPCVALAYDISGFFDNLEHQLLRQQDRWDRCCVLRTASLLRSRCESPASKSKRGFGMVTTYAQMSICRKEQTEG